MNLSYANYNWWQNLQDPVLDCLINEALENNKDLKTAIYRVFEFYGQFLNCKYHYTLK